MLTTTLFMKRIVFELEDLVLRRWVMHDGRVENFVHLKRGTFKQGKIITKAWLPTIMPDIDQKI